MTYQDKLKDPRWQKKRLQILERDNWTCQECYNSDRTLHVHHKFYEKGREPWDIDNDLLTTLCKDCHKSEGDVAYHVNQGLIKEIRKHFTSLDIINIILGLRSMQLVHKSDVVSTSIQNSLSDKDIQSKLVDIMFEEMENATT